jgi:UDP-N-acetylmuramoylalanine--D-glutamate ligase
VADLTGWPPAGKHNLSNAAAATAAALCLGIDHHTIREGLLGFRPAEHRLEFAGQFQGVKFYNDSKATNSDAVKKALSSYKEPVILIAGGRAKEQDYSSVMRTIQSRTKALCLFGESRDLLYRVLPKSHRSKAATFEELRAAFDHAVSLADEGDVVLFSPMCSSFDQYSDYMERGEHFKKLVRSLTLGDSDPGTTTLTL